ncbi:HIRAN domain-containing protein [Solirubrobacter sp. CPCC 204708]|uniref:HIRAN domain-containing protein n=1 Tax=Solirubrobacter deserti TaxID=2282478 RepID=A0ABT4RJD0_9ACTN|nr:HIRAN domain-containing protein [Solirubrobacter deserti]MBE2319845.1 HIRAN domain-containing protein [Solirubrobacter deserti]MDA0138674.1 HIRAN domain-containing protein [Solirubrobacter deserti]
MIVPVERQEQYWYPDDGGEVWVAGFQLVDDSGRFLGRDALPDGLIVANVAGAVHRPEALASDLAAPGSVLRLRPEPSNPHDPSAVAVDLGDGTPLGYVPREYTVEVVGWNALVLRERRRSPRDPRDGVTMLLSREPVELRVTA